MSPFVTWAARRHLSTPPMTLAWREHVHQASRGPSDPDSTGHSLSIATWFGKVFLFFVLGLVAWGTLPALFGWHTSVVLTGSMRPHIEPGDLVVSAPVAAAEIHPGQVIAFAAPTEHTVVHRVVDVRADATLVTKGDANPTNDAISVKPEQIAGLGRLRVPLIGQPIVWAREHNYPPLILLGLLTVVAVWLVLREGVRRRRRTAYDRDHVDGAESKPGTGPPKPHPSLSPKPRPTPPLAAGLGRLTILVVATGIIVATGEGSAQAAFGVTASASANAWGLSSYAQFGAGTYVSTVTANAPRFFYRLTESSGTVVTDTSGFGGNGTYVSTWTRSVSPQPLPRNAGLAVSPAAALSCISTPTAFANPTVYSYEVWFRTTSITGGKLVGFENLKTGTSASFDRHLYMRNDGTLVFGVKPGAQTTVSSPASYNDGNWHQAVATMGTVGGMSLYVDGFLVASNATTGSANFTGYWRIGCGTLTGWPTYPTTPSATRFTGSLGDVSIYTTELTAVDVRNHFFAA